MNARKMIFVRQMREIGYRVEDIYASFNEILSDGPGRGHTLGGINKAVYIRNRANPYFYCLLYTSDAADD